ncbi:unnamed protein product [Camellia sinensis]
MKWSSSKIVPLYGIWVKEVGEHLGDVLYSNRYDDERHSRSRSYERTPPSRGGSPDGRNHKECSPTLKSVSLCGRPADSQSPSRHSNAAVRIGSDIVCDESSARILLVVLCS